MVSLNLDTQGRRRHRRGGGSGGGGGDTGGGGDQGNPCADGSCGNTPPTTTITCGSGEYITDAGYCADICPTGFYYTGSTCEPNEGIGPAPGGACRERAVTGDCLDLPAQCPEGDTYIIDGIPSGCNFIEERAPLPQSQWGEFNCRVLKTEWVNNVDDTNLDEVVSIAANMLDDFDDINFKGFSSLRPGFFPSYQKGGTDVFTSLVYQWDRLTGRWWLSIVQGEIFSDKACLELDVMSVKLWEGCVSAQKVENIQVWQVSGRR